MSLNQKQLYFLYGVKKIGLPLKLIKRIFFTAFPTLTMWKRYLDLDRTWQFGMIVHDLPEIISNEDQYQKWLQEARKLPRNDMDEYLIKAGNEPYSRCIIAMGLFRRSCGFIEKIPGNCLEEWCEDYAEYSIPRTGDLVTKIRVEDDLPYDIIKYNGQIYPKNTIIRVIGGFDDLYRIRVYHQNYEKPIKIHLTYYLLNGPASGPGSGRYDRMLVKGPENGQCMICERGFTKFLSAADVEIHRLYSTVKFQLEIMEIIQQRFYPGLAEIINKYIKTFFKHGLYDCDLATYKKFSKII